MKPLQFALFAFACFFTACCGPREKPSHQSWWKQSDNFTNTERLIDPKGYIDFLKQKRFIHGELDSLPTQAIVLHDARVPAYLDSLGFTNEEITVLRTGTTDPSILYVVRSRKQHVRFIITPGCPGTGGVATQIAELGGMGVKAVIHIGTCGLLGEGVSDQNIIVSSGAYKDGGSALLSTEPADGDNEIALPDQSLSDTIWTQLNRAGYKATKAYGFTIPIFYYQPSGLIKDILHSTSPKAPCYVEMEGSAVFAVAKLANMKSASIVLGTDRYTLETDVIKHNFIDYNSDKLKIAAVKQVIQLFKE